MSDVGSPLAELDALAPYLCIAVEGKETRDGRLLLPGVVNWQYGHSLPLRVLPVGSPPEHGHAGARLVGSVVVSRTHSFGAVSDVMAYLYLKPEDMPEGQIALGIDLDELGFVMREGTLTVTHARLRAVTILPGSAGVWPEVVYDRI